METIRIKPRLIFLALIFGLISVQGCELKADEWTTLFGTSNHVYTAEDVTLVDYGTVWCNPCRQMKRDVFPKLKGICEVHPVDADSLSKSEREERGITHYPTLKLIVRDPEGVWRHLPRSGSTANGVSRTEFVQWVGYTSLDKIKTEVNRVLKELNSNVSKGSPAVEFKETPERSFKNKPPQVKVAYETTELVKIPGSGWNEGRTACGDKTCSMCYSQYITQTVTKYRTEDAGQANCPQEVVDKMLKSLNVKEGDHLLDIGCGDGNILRTAVSRYGCTGIGIEIDPVKVKQARELIEKEGMSDRIVIIEMDAALFKPEDYGVTCAVAYLYPETLEKLLPMLEPLSRFASAFHDVPGLEMSKIDKVYLRKNNFANLFP